VTNARPTHGRCLDAAGTSVLRLALCLVVFCTIAPAQVFHLQAGDSTLYNSYGGSIGFQAPGYEGWVGAGAFNGTLRNGAFVKTDLYGCKLRAGDDAIRLSLPTDVLGGGSGISYRGLGLESTVHRLKVLAFGGASSFNYSTTFFQAAAADTPVGGLYLDLPLSAKVHLFSRNVFSTSQTSIQGLTYEPRKWLSTALAAGIGSGKGLFSSSLVAERSWISVKAEYANVGDGFRRFVMQPNSSEVQGKNLLVTLRPKPSLSLGGSYQNVYEPLTDSNTIVHGSVSSLFANGSVLGARVGGTFYQSQVQGQSSQGLTMNGSYRFAGRLETSLGYFASHADRNAWQGSTTASTREIINSRFKLVQTVTRSAGQTNLMFGGDLILRRATIGVDHQTIYLPFAGGGFKQVLSINLRLRPFGQVELAGNTVTTPDGKLKFTATAGDYVYRSGGSSGDKNAAMAFSDHVVRGRVTDESGNPIAGAALHIDGVVAYTDSEGKFLVRMKKAQSYPFKVALDEFVTPSLYEVVSAPTEVKPESESTAPEIKVLLRRVPQTSHRKQLPETSQNIPHSPLP
jgi:hypothetical protein